MRFSLEKLFQKCRICVLLPILLLADFLSILCSLYDSIINIIFLFASRSTFGAFWERKIPFKIGYIRDMETNVINDLFALSSWFLKIWTRSSHRMWKTRSQTLYIIFESQFGIMIPKIQNLCFLDYLFRKPP